MNNPTLFLIFSLVILCACQNTEQQAHKDDVAPIDTSLAVTDVPIDSTLAATTDSHEETMLPDSVKITLISTIYGANIVFSINHDKESTIELNPGEATMSEKVKLSKTYTIQILRNISEIFLEHKTPIIIAKKSHYPIVVEAGNPWIKFVIYSKDKTIETENIFVGKYQDYYEITYSDTFLELYNLLNTKAEALCELKR